MITGNVNTGDISDSWWNKKKRLESVNSALASICHDLFVTWKVEESDGNRENVRVAILFCSHQNSRPPNIRTSTKCVINQIGRKRHNMTTINARKPKELMKLLSSSPMLQRSLCLFVDGSTVNRFWFACTGRHRVGEESKQELFAPKKCVKRERRFYEKRLKWQRMALETCCWAFFVCVCNLFPVAQWMAWLRLLPRTTRLRWETVLNNDYKWLSIYMHLVRRRCDGAQ